MPTDPSSPALPAAATVREAVASFATKPQLRAAVAALLGAGFAPSDLSVLATHDSLEVAGGVPAYPSTPGETLAAGLTDEANYIIPLAVAGVALVSGGPVAAALAALVGAGLSGVALKDVLDRITANRHSATFAAALEAGAVLLWARTGDKAREATALRLLQEAGGRHAHIHARPAT
jgi:hypothetical protein